MKFRDGYWLLKEGIEVENPAEVFDIKPEEEELTVYAPDRHINNRAATLNCPLFTLKFSSPLPDVIRVQIYHHRGQEKKGPEFEINEQKGTDIDIDDNEDDISLKSGDLRVKINKNSWAVQFYNKEKQLTGSGSKGTGYVTDEDNKTYMKEELSLGVGECVYGLGERFTSFVKNGQSVDIWNKDGGTSSNQAYKNIPFYLTDKGYGVFINHPEKVSLEVGSESVSRVQFSVPGEYLEYFIINGPSLKEVLSRYTSLTGRPALPPAWSFGLWLTTSFTTDYDEGKVTEIIEQMADRDIPLHVFHFDCFWMKAYHWCNFKWDEQIFPDPEGMLKRLKEKGLKICLWINPYIAQQSDLFDEGKENGYLLTRPNGDVWQWDMWQAGMGIVDFTNPEARKWYKDKLRKLLEMGVDCFKTDFGERIPTDVEYYDGSDPVKMHNYYTYLYNETVFELLEEEGDKDEAVLFARSATAGSQKFPVHWGGDCYSNYQSMAESLRGGLSLGLSGFGYWSHDIGGFEETATADVYKRWIAFGLLSSHSRLHGSSSYRVPWLFDEEAVDVLRFFTQLKCSLMPYLFKHACQAHEEGIPMMRAMILEFEDDPGCKYLDQQYMLGDSLLVAPVFNPDGRVSYYLPEGTWTNFLTGEKIEGEKWVTEEYDYMGLPLLVRPNSIIPVGNNRTDVDYDYINDVTFHVFELENNNTASTEIYNRDGEVEFKINITKRGNKIIVKTDTENKGKTWSLLLRNVRKIESVNGAILKEHDKGIELIPEQGINNLEVITG